MREAGLALMSLVMEEEVRHLARERHDAGGKKPVLRGGPGRSCRSSEPVCARRKSNGDPRMMMMNYTHVASEDGRLFAAKVGRLLEPRDHLRLPMPAGRA